MYLHCVCFVPECVPDPGAFDTDSDMGHLVAKVHKLFQEAEANPPAQPLPMEETEESKEALHVLGLKLGDKVLVGGVKVRDCI